MSKGLYKLRRRIGRWYIDITSATHKLIEIRGPFSWQEMGPAAQQCEIDGYEKEQ
jgi:hypothetical protein